MATRRQERRKHRRAKLPCPLILRDRDGNVLAKTRAENISDGGVFLTMPIDSLPRFGNELNLSFSVPRSTPNTYMLEEFKCRGKVVRQQPLTDTDRAGMGLQFNKPLPLMLEV